MISLARTNRLQSQAVWTTAVVVILLQLAVLFGIHLLSLMLGQGGFYPIVLGGDDGKFHYAVARYMLDTNQIGTNFSFTEVTVWPSVIAEFMKLTGTDSILLIKQMLLFGRVVDILAGLIALEALRKSSRLPETPHAVFWSRVAVIVLVGVYPSGIFYSFGSVYRDALIYGFHFLTVALLLHAITDPRPAVKVGFLALALPPLYALYQLRQYAGYAIVLGLLAWLLARGLRRASILVSRDPTFRQKVVFTGMAALVIAGGSALWYTRPIQQLIAFRDSYFLTPGSNLGISFTGRNPIQAAPYYAYSWISNVIGPLPWQVRNASNLLALVIEIPLLAYVGYGIWRRHRSLSPACTFLLYQAAVWFSLIAFSNDNLGTASRLRVLGWQCLIVVFTYVVPRVRMAAKVPIGSAVLSTASQRG